MIWLILGAFATGMLLAILEELVNKARYNKLQNDFKEHSKLVQRNMKLIDKILSNEREMLGKHEDENESKRFCITCGKEIFDVPPTCSSECSEIYFNKIE